MDEEDKVYIYGLIDPETKECRYIGRTSNPDKRYAHHIGVATNPLNIWIGNLCGKGQTPTMKVLETCKDSIAADRENHWIDEMGGLDNLLNNVIAGKGTKRGKNRGQKSIGNEHPVYNPGQIIKSTPKAMQISIDTRKARRRIRKQIHPKSQPMKIKDDISDEPAIDVQSHKSPKWYLSAYPADVRIRQSPKSGCHDPDCVECHARQGICWQMKVYGGYRMSKRAKKAS